MPLLSSLQILIGRGKMIPARLSDRDPLLRPSHDVERHVADGVPDLDDSISDQLSKWQVNAGKIFFSLMCQNHCDLGTAYIQLVNSLH